MFFISAQNQFLPFIVYLYVIGVFMFAVGTFVGIKCSAVSRFFLENNLEYRKLSPELKKLVVLPKWHVKLVRGFGIFLAVIGLAIIIATTVIQL